MRRTRRASSRTGRRRRAGCSRRAWRRRRRSAAARRPARRGTGRRAGRGWRSSPRVASSSLVFGWSRNSRSSPLTLKISALVLALSPAPPSTPERSIEYMRKVAKLVFVATPEIPEIDTWAPRLPSMKSAFRNSGSPSRPKPIGTWRSMRSKYSAWSRAWFRARCTTAPGLRRHVDLRRHPGGGDLGGLLDLGRQRAVGDREDVGVEHRALVPGPHGGDHAGDGDRRPVGQLPAGDHDVVELQVGAGRHGHPELERRRVGRAEHPPDDGAFHHGRSHKIARTFVCILPHAPPERRAARRGRPWFPSILQLWCLPEPGKSGRILAPQLQDRRG